MKVIKHSPGKEMPLDQAFRRHTGIYIQRQLWGKTIVQKWPKKRTRPPTAAELEQQDEFKRLVEATKNVMPDEADAAREIAENSKNTWRDIISKMLVGRLVDFPNYGEIVSQYNLDILGTDPGMTIVRGEDEWFALPPGPDTYLLTMVDGMPEWTEPTPIPPPEPSEIHPGWITGRYYAPPNGGSTGSLSASVLRATLLPVPPAGVITHGSINVTLAQASSEVTIGVYENANGLPGALLSTIGALATTTNGVKTITGLSIPFVGPYIWLVGYQTGTPQLSLVAASAAFGPTYLGMSAPSVSLTQPTGWQANHTYSSGSLPDPFPTPTQMTTAAPLIWVGN